MFIRNVQQFYNDLSSDYDAMTSFHERFIREEPHFRLFIKRYNIRTAIDAGSGTGFHSLMLAKLGVETTAVDFAGKMLRHLKLHAEDLKLRVRTVKKSLETIDKILIDPVDAVFCLGNTLSHISSKKDFLHIIRNFYKLLDNDGVVIVQILNYRRILNSRDRILSIKECGDKTYIRFYGDGRNPVKFNILTLERNGTTLNHTLRTTELYPFFKEQAIETFRKAGFATIKFYGGLDYQRYSQSGSHDLVIVALKT